MSPMSRLPYFLGCPVWACASWVGGLYTSKSRKKWLNEYSTVFNTVEGNSTFYGLPGVTTVERWGSETQPGFQFALKFPKSVTHDCQLVGGEHDTRLFLRILEILAKADRLGPSMIQLPPYFAGRQLGSLAKFLRRLPREFPYAVEVRHFDFFDNGACESRLVDLLTGFGVDWVAFDSRALFSKPPSDEYERESQTRKPRTPFRTTVTAGNPVLRLVGRNNVIESRMWIEEWVDVVAGWIRDGLNPYVFTHSPDDTLAPEFAREFHARLTDVLEGLPPLGELERPLVERQGELFGS